MHLKRGINIIIAKLRNNKVAGPDLISTEMLKGSEELGVDILHEICIRVWKNRVWMEDWTTSVIIPSHMTGKTQCCANYRNISLISHASKIFYHLLRNKGTHE